MGNYSRYSKKLGGYFFEDVPMPEGINTQNIEDAMVSVVNIFDAINKGLRNNNLPPLHEIIRNNAYSGLVSDFVTVSLSRYSHFDKNEDTKFPDLINPRTGVGLEVKATMREPWGTVGHNVARGWFIVFQFEISKNGVPKFTTVWIGKLDEEDFVFRDRKPTSRRTITASVKKESWDQKMKIVFKKSSEQPLPI